MTPPLVVQMAVLSKHLELIHICKSFCKCPCCPRPLQLHKHWRMCNCKELAQADLMNEEARPAEKPEKLCPSTCYCASPPTSLQIVRTFVADQEAVSGKEHECFLCMDNIAVFVMKSCKHAGICRSCRKELPLVGRSRRSRRYSCPACRQEGEMQLVDTFPKKIYWQDSC